MPRRCASRCTSAHFSVGAFVSAQMRLRTLVLEDLGAAAGKRLQPGLLEAREDVRDVVFSFFARKWISGAENACRWTPRVRLAQEREELLVEGERQLGVDAALQEDARAAERDRLLDLLPDLLERRGRSPPRRPPAGRRRRTRSGRCRRSCS